MTYRGKNFLRNLKFNLTGWLIAGLLYVFVRFYGTLDENFMPLSMVNIGYNFLQGIVVSIISGTLITVLDYLIDTEKFRKRSFRYIVITKSIIYSAAMVVCIVLIAVTDSFLPHHDVYFYKEIDPSVLQTVALQYMLVVFIYGIIVNVLINLIKEADKKFGPGIMLKLFSGRYHQPKIENRIFMFLDLKSSTTIAEKLGHIKYSLLIQDCFYEVTDVIDRYHAEIYQYVGDEIVLTWEIEKGIENENCFRFYFEFMKKLAESGEYYKKKYSIMPEFKAGANCGPVTVCEIGEIKKDIAYHGDVLNTASRIQGLCNTYDKSVLISQDMHNKMPKERMFRRELIGEIILKGKQTPVNVYSLEMA